MGFTGLYGAEVVAKGLIGNPKPTAILKGFF